MIDTIKEDWNRADVQELISAPTSIQWDGEQWSVVIIGVRWDSIDKDWQGSGATPWEAVMNTFPERFKNTSDTIEEAQNE